MKTQEVKNLHELSIANDFAKYINNYGDKYIVDQIQDPPDAILKSIGGESLWIEITDIFRSREEAEEVYSYARNRDYKRPQEVIIEPDLGICLSTIKGVERKIHKSSYTDVLSEYGKGVLILWIYDPLFTESTLKSIKDNFKEISLESKYFKHGYIYWPDLLDRKFEKLF